MRGQSILITGGTGTLGRSLTKHLLLTHNPRSLIIYSRGELKQFEMSREFPDTPTAPTRYIIGDVRDKERLVEACEGVDIIIHAAALKQVPACELNPNEAVSTNITGTQNVIRAAITQGVSKVLLVSTDKAVEPINLYGMTKAVAEKLIINANTGRYPWFSVTRYGNVMGSRGSVIPYFFALKAANKPLPITDPKMTRFWMEVDEAVGFVDYCVSSMTGGEIFIPVLKAVKIVDLARAIDPSCNTIETGVRQGEKLHEMLISPNEREVVMQGDHFVIHPLGHQGMNDEVGYKGLLKGEMEYSSRIVEKYQVREIRHKLVEMSFKGRTAGFDPANDGSIPSISDQSTNPPKEG